MGSASRHIRSIAVAAIAGVGLVACSGGGDDDAALSSDAAPAATVDAAGAADGDSRLVATGDEQAPAEMETGGDVTGAGTEDLAATQALGQAIAIEARATLEADDVKAAVDRVTSAVTTRGGRIAAADIDYGRATEDGAPQGSHAMLVLEVPPQQLPAVVDALEELGTVLSFDQFAEDVTDQLADLDTRIANLRASVERVRTLYAEAVDIDSIVRLEAELTRRETDLEVLLATQSAIEDRVTMSTLTVDVTATPGALESDDDPGILDAAGAGWSAFVGGLFAVVLVLAAIAPFVVAALSLAVVALWIRQLALRRRPAPTATFREQEPAREPETASRQG